MPHAFLQVVPQKNYLIVTQDIVADDNYSLCVGLADPKGWNVDTSTCVSVKDGLCCESGTISRRESRLLICLQGNKPVHGWVEYLNARGCCRVRLSVMRHGYAPGHPEPCAARSDAQTALPR